MSYLLVVHLLFLVFNACSVACVLLWLTWPPSVHDSAGDGRRFGLIQFFGLVIWTSWISVDTPFDLNFVQKGGFNFVKHF